MYTVIVPPEREVAGCQTLAPAYLRGAGVVQRVVLPAESGNSRLATGMHARLPVLVHIFGSSSVTEAEGVHVIGASGHPIIVFAH